MQCIAGKDEDGEVKGKVLPKNGLNDCGTLPGEVGLCPFNLISLITQHCLLTLLFLHYVKFPGNCDM